MANQTKLTYDAWLGADVLDVGRRLMVGLHSTKMGSDPISAGLS